MTAPRITDTWTWLARILRPQGRKGEVFAEILTDFPEKFAQRRRLWLLAENLPARAGHSAQVQAPLAAPGEVELAAHWPHKGGIVLHFAGVDSIMAAEALQGLIVAIPRGQRVVPGEDEVYVGDLIGCVLMDVAGAAPVEIGKIEDVDRTAGEAALLVLRSTAGEVLIPFAKSYLRRIDLDNKRVEMALPEGLANLNSSEKS
jgi:16S rRNA processing protein RimM